jgi:hypothetical protein
MAARLAENIALIVDTAIAIKVTSKKHNAASAASFCCEASCLKNDSRMSDPPGVAVASAPTRSEHAHE